MKRIIILVLLCALLTACNKVAEQSPKSNVTTEDTHIDISTLQQMTDDQKADHLSELAINTPQVNEATSIVLGDIAVIAIDVDDNLSDSRVSTIKYTVAESLKKDPQGANAFVVADPDLRMRILKVKDSINEGAPIAGVLTELSNIISRLIPDMPQMIQTNPSDETTDLEGEPIKDSE